MIATFFILVADSSDGVPSIDGPGNLITFLLAQILGLILPRMLPLNFKSGQLAVFGEFDFLALFNHPDFGSPVI